MVIADDNAVRHVTEIIPRIYAGTEGCGRRRLRRADIDIGSVTPVVESGAGDAVDEVSLNQRRCVITPIYEMWAAILGNHGSGEAESVVIVRIFHGGQPPLFQVTDAFDRFCDIPCSS